MVCLSGMKIRFLGWRYKIKSFDQFVCLGGLPRTGSTLLSGLLSQNPTIHAEGASGLCQIMWDTKVSCEGAANKELLVSSRTHSVHDIVSQLPHAYYKRNDPQERIVVDKCRSWPLPANTQMLDDFIGRETKVIVLVRPIVEVVRSFVGLHKANNCYSKQAERAFIEDSDGPVLRSLSGIHSAHRSDSDRFLFVSYKSIVEDTAKTLKGIYDFCGWKHFIHNTKNVQPRYVENDNIFGLKGHHTVREKVEYRENHTELMDETIQRCAELDSALNLDTLTVNLKKLQKRYE